jgi:hypothetical protein
VRCVCVQAWAASSDDEAWHVWVNATVPTASEGATIEVMLPISATHNSVCAWECGLGGVAHSFTSQWVSFDGGGGHRRLRAIVPPPSAGTAPPARQLDHHCMQIWHRGAISALPPLATGIDGINWSVARPGYTKFPSLALVTTSGTYAVFARPC